MPADGLPVLQALAVGVLYDYFVASSDEEAAAMIEDGPDGELLVLELKGLNPGDLVDVEELLTDVSVDAICERTQFPGVIVALNDNHKLVLPLNDELRDALAGATAETDSGCGVLGRDSCACRPGGCRRLGRLARPVRHAGPRSPGQRSTPVLLGLRLTDVAATVYGSYIL